MPVGKVGIERDRVFRRANGLVMAPHPEIGHGKRPLRIGISVVERNCAPDRLIGEFERLRRRRAPLVEVVVHMRGREKGVGGRKIGVEFDRVH